MFDSERIDPPRDGELQVCYATDGGYAPRVEVSAYTLLRHATCPIRFILVGTDDVKGSFGRMERMIAQHPNARIDYIFPDFIRQRIASHTHYLPVPAFGRMLIPHLMSGRVLYLDGDTFVRRDVSPALTMDLEGKPAAAAIDQLFRRMYWREKFNLDASNPTKRMLAERGKADLDRFRKLDIDVQYYINSGVMVFDCEAIQADPDLMQASLDYDFAQTLPTFDQDLINVIYAGKLKFLDPEWNVWHGVSRTGSKPFPPEEIAYFKNARQDPKIIHFYANPKPWDKWDIKHFQRGFRWQAAYWRTEARVAREFGA